MEIEIRDGDRDVDKEGFPVLPEIKIVFKKCINNYLYYFNLVEIWIKGLLNE